MKEKLNYYSCALFFYIFSDLIFDTLEMRKKVASPETWVVEKIIGHDPKTATVEDFEAKNSQWGRKDVVTEKDL